MCHKSVGKDLHIFMLPLMTFYSLCSMPKIATICSHVQNMKREDERDQNKSKLSEDDSSPTRVVFHAQKHGQLPTDLIRCLFGFGIFGLLVYLLRLQGKFYFSCHYLKLLLRITGNTLLIFFFSVIYIFLS